jgi:hypothetical protein
MAVEPLVGTVVRVLVWIAVLVNALGDAEPLVRSPVIS